MSHYATTYHLELIQRSLRRAVKQVNESEAAFKSAQELLKNAIFLKQQLKCEEQKRRGATAARDTSSVYKRLSAHIQTTLDLPDLDLSGIHNEVGNNSKFIMRSSSRNFVHSRIQGMNTMHFKWRIHLPRNLNDFVIESNQYYMHIRRKLN